MAHTQKFHEGQTVRILPNARFGNNAYFNSFEPGVEVRVVRPTPDGDGDIRVALPSDPWGYYIREDGVEAVDAVQEPQDIPTRIAALRAELEALEATQAAEEEIVASRARDMRRVMNEAQGGHNGLAWATVRRGYMALARAYVPAP